MFLLSRSINRGGLRSAGISRFIASHCSTPASITRDVALQHPLFTLDAVLGYSFARVAGSPRALGSSLAWFVTCRCAARCRLRPRGVGFTLVHIALTAWPTPNRKGSARSQNCRFSGLVSDSGQTPFTSLHSLVLLQACAFSRYTTEWLTRPYSGGLIHIRRTPSRRVTIARLPLVSWVP